MKNSGLYSDAHLVTAAIRILEHRNSAPASVDDVCQTLSFSIEQGHFVCRKLKEMGIIDVVEGAFGTRLFIKNHLKIEEIPKDEKDSSLTEALKKFQNAKKDFSKKIESFQAQQTKKQQDLFAELEKKMKKGSGKKEKGP
jgi:hypothetical protein